MRQSFPTATAGETRFHDFDGNTSDEVDEEAQYAAEARVCSARHLIQ